MVGFCRLSQCYQSPGVSTLGYSCEIFGMGPQCIQTRHRGDKLSRGKHDLSQRLKNLGEDGHMYGQFKATLLHEESYQKVCTCVVANVDREVQLPGVEVLHVIGSGTSRYQCSVIRAYTSLAANIARYVYRSSALAPHRSNMQSCQSVPRWCIQWFGAGPFCIPDLSM
jgi:hypothetical protein